MYQTDRDPFKINEGGYSESGNSRKMVTLDDEKVEYQCQEGVIDD